MLYFAYGSNLDAENWALWCETKGYDSVSIEPLGPAWLPDHELVFHYQSCQGVDGPRQPCIFVSRMTHSRDSLRSSFYFFGFSD